LLVIEHRIINNQQGIFNNQFSTSTTNPLYQGGLRGVFFLAQCTKGKSENKYPPLNKEYSIINFLPGHSLFVIENWILLL